MEGWKEGSVCKMNRPVAETTEVMRALWFRIPPRPKFLVFLRRPRCLALQMKSYMYIGECVYVHVSLIVCLNK